MSDNSKIAIENEIDNLSDERTKLLLKLLLSADIISHTQMTTGINFVNQTRFL